MSERLVIIGGGQAAAQLIEAARDEGFDGPITLVGDEPLPPYARPPLSKQFLTGAHTLDWLAYRPAGFYDRHAANLRLGVRATHIDRSQRIVTLADGDELAYGQLALTTGTRVRRLAIPGADLNDVYYIRTAADSQAIMARLDQPRRVVIIGGGFIGLEAAAILIKLGHAVTVLAAHDRLLPRVVDPIVSAFYREVHERAGVRIVTGALSSQIDQVGKTLTVTCADNTTHHCDIIIIGIGVVPNDELASTAGLPCEDGIIVDAFGRTADPQIVAAGDCTCHPNAWAGRNIRLETVHNAVEQPKSAGAAVAGRLHPYHQAPWVWSDQYDLRLQAVGIIDGYDQTVTRGATASGRFSIFYFRAGKLVAMNAINRPGEFGAVRRILNANLDIKPEQAADLRFDLDAVAPRRIRLEFDEPWTRGTRPGLALAK